MTIRFRHLNRVGSFPSGNPRFYFRPKGEKSIPMPDADRLSEEFRVAYEKAEATLPHKPVSARRRSVVDSAIRESLVTSLKRVDRRSVECGRAFDLDIDFLYGIYLSQHRRCALTGSPFDLKFPAGLHGRRPFAPSIDRIDYMLGYIKPNVRLVCTIANLARGDFGDETFFRMCKDAAIFAKKRR